ncbi:MAG TPA: phosphomannomutase/phosphoglucomutase [Planctomycetota bacterium]|nr:phosphomannomutase/phosphoglucomutase [Planctomycetota bacterium]
MDIPPEDIHAVFQTYDIRGRFPKPLSPHLVYAVGRTLAAYLHEAMRVKTGRVAIGRDMRRGSDELAAAVAAGLQEGRVAPVDLGLVSTDMVYFAAGEYPTTYDGAVMITASHNPPHDNGLKFVLSCSRSIDANTGLNIIRDMMLSRNAPVPDDLPPLTAERRDVADAYVEKLFSIAPGPFAPVKVVVDAGNGMATAIFPLFARRLPCEIIPIHFTLDGGFPDRDPDPTVPGALDKLRAAVREHHADLGLAFDGDADRALIVDEQGERVSGSHLTALFAQVFLRTRPRQPVLFDLTCSLAVRDCILEANGTPIVAPVGHSRIKERMYDAAALFGGEESGHYYFRDFYCCDSGMLASLVLLQLLAATGQPLSALVRPLASRYHRVGDVRRFGTREEAIERVARVDAEFPAAGAEATRIGPDVRKDFADWWYCVRPSGAERGLLRVTVEACDPAVAAARLADILAIIDR